MSKADRNELAKNLLIAVASRSLIHGRMIDRVDGPEAATVFFGTVPKIVMTWATDLAELMESDS